MERDMIKVKFWAIPVSKKCNKTISICDQNEEGGINRMKQKTMRKKKAGRFLTLVLAVAMSLSLSGTPVFAAPAGDDIVVQNEGGEGDPVE
ncbi:MAG: hypothetical protein IKN79_11460, partial [Eubacterium sp.]|nr:hypothetical protein [Eubacterium sp.]